MRTLTNIFNPLTHKKSNALTKRTKEVQKAVAKNVTTSSVVEAKIPEKDHVFHEIASAKETAAFFKKYKENYTLEFPAVGEPGSDVLKKETEKIMKGMEYSTPEQMEKYRNLCFGAEQIKAIKEGAKKNKDMQKLLLTIEAKLGHELNIQA